MAIDIPGITSPSEQRLKNEAEIERANQAFQESRDRLQSFEFSNPYEGLGPAQAQAGTLGEASTYEAEGYTAQGYDAERAKAAQAQKTQLGESTGRTNQFANLQVNTAAADLQARETDEALAAALESGAITGAGGATALAQQAAKSKAGISADISQQEAQNAQLRAQGATDVQKEALAQRNLSRQTNIQQDQFNVGLQQQTNLANQAAANQAAQFSASAQNQAAQFTASEKNQAYRFGAQAQNEFARAQFDADNQFAQFNVSNLNQFALQEAAGASQQEQNQYNALANIYAQDANLKVSATEAEANRKANNLNAAINAGTGLLNAATSDPKAKKSISVVGASPSGIPIYNFKYKKGKGPKGTYQGTMSTDVPNATIKGKKGKLDKVDYSKTDVKFKKIK